MGAADLEQTWQQFRSENQPPYYPPRALVSRPHLIYAAIAEPNPSVNKEYVEAMYGINTNWATVTDFMLFFAEPDIPQLRSGVAMVSYWLPGTLGPIPFDVAVRLNNWFLATFLQDSDATELSSLLSAISFRSDYVAHCTVSIDDVVAKAQSHPSDSVRDAFARAHR